MKNVFRAGRIIAAAILLAFTTAVIPARSAEPPSEADRAFASAFTPATRLDWTTLAKSIHDDLLFHETMKRWRHNADDYVNIAIGGVFSILSRKFAPTTCV